MLGSFTGSGLRLELVHVWALRATAHWQILDLGFKCYFFLVKPLLNYTCHKRLSWAKKNGKFFISFGNHCPESSAKMLFKILKILVVQCEVTKGCVHLESHVICLCWSNIVNADIYQNKFGARRASFFRLVLWRDFIFQHDMAPAHTEKINTLGQVY